MQHLLDLTRHVGHVDVGLERRLAVELQDALADVDAEVADALEVGDELEGHGEEPQVGGHRLSARQHLHAELVHFHLELVDLAVGGDHLFGQHAVALDERADAAVDHLLDLGAHEQELLADATELALVLAVGVRACLLAGSNQPNRPVM